MIQGLQVRITSEQLMPILEERRDAHRETAKRYQARANEMREAGDDPKMAVSNDKSTVESFERRASEHTQKAQEFQVLREYLPNGEIFQLVWEDLRRLELVGSY